MKLTNFWQDSSNKKENTTVNKSEIKRVITGGVADYCVYI